MIRKLLATAAVAALLPLMTSVPALAESASPTTSPAASPPASAAASLAAAPTASPAVSPAAEIPCPKPKVALPANRPPRPVPPPDNVQNSQVGGDALATHGLAIPSGATAPPAVMATSWVVADLDTGEVLGACGPHVYQTPASVQKTLLAATTMNELNPSQVITVVPSDLKIDPGSSAVGLLVGGKYTISTLWLGVMLNSGNDAANTLARLAGGGGPDGVAKTVAAMNAEAQSLGAYQTHAVTPSGLDGKGQFTSAYDLALIARVNFDRPAFIKYALTKAAQMPAQPQLKKGGFQFQNENKMIYNYPGALGGKPGYTTIARTSYVAAAQRGGRRLVVTLLGSEVIPMRGWQQGEALLNWGFAQPKGSSVGHLVTPQEVAAAQKTESATQGASPRTHPVASRSGSGGGHGTTVLLGVVVALILIAAPLLLLTLRRTGHRGKRRMT